LEKQNLEKSRIIGLDLLRVIAVVLVTYMHILIELPELYFGFNSLKFLPRGSDVFLVLSGFLVGQIIIKACEKAERVNFQFVRNFLFRRWLRTIPAYYLILAVQALLLYFGLVKGTLNVYFFAYPIFMQNFIIHFDFLMWESWSLSVHEWFYVIFPFMVLVLLRLKVLQLSKKKVLLIAILSMTLFSIAFRMQLNADLDWDLYYRKLVLSRLDSIGIGLLVAFVKVYYPQVFTKFKWHYLLIGLVAYHFCWHYSYQNQFFNQVPYLTLVAICIALSIPWFYQITTLGKLNSPVYWLSQVSYSFYLVHLPLLQTIITLKKQYQWEWNWTIVLPIYLILALMLSFALHLGYERKFIQFGNRFK
jgi:peptidoglycan/LPS O-acetylase OafA/YrhL